MTGTFAAWRTPSASSGGGNCAEAGTGTGVTAVRDSKLGDASPVLEFGPGARRAFTAAVKAS